MKKPLSCIRVEFLPAQPIASRKFCSVCSPSTWQQKGTADRALCLAIPAKVHRSWRIVCSDCKSSNVAWFSLPVDQFEKSHLSIRVGSTWYQGNEFWILSAWQRDIDSVFLIPRGLSRVLRVYLNGCMHAIGMDHLGVSGHRTYHRGVALTTVTCYGTARNILFHHGSLPRIRYPDQTLYLHTPRGDRNRFSLIDRSFIIRKHLAISSEFPSKL